MVNDLMWMRWGFRRGVLTPSNGEAGVWGASLEMGYPFVLEQGMKGFFSRGEIFKGGKLRKN